jgi:hypothetical protein
MSVKNVVFDMGGVLLEWNPPAVIARLHPDPATQARIREQMFEHADWHEFDRGGLTYDGAIQHFAKQTGLTPDETRALIHAPSCGLSGVYGCGITRQCSGPARRARRGKISGRSGRVGR